MTQQAQQSVLAWLKDAHAMEAGGVITLTNHAEAAGDYPELQAKLREHADTTRRHADLVEGCIERLGGHPSSLKEAVGAVASKIAGVANLPAQDTVIKNALGDLAAENFEIASYVSLIAAAEHTGDEQTASVCRQILADEREMAAFIEAQIPVATRQFLARTSSESDGGGVLGAATQAAKNLGEQGSELAGKVTSGDGRNALLVSGALLAGAGAALLVGQALLGGSERGKDSDDTDVPQYPTQDASAGTEAAADAGAYAVPSETPIELSDDVPSDVSSLSDDLSDSLGEGMGEETGSSDPSLEAAPALSEPLDDAVMLEETEVVGTLEVSGGDEIVIETLSEDARFLMASEPAADPVVEDAGEAALATDSQLQADAEVPEAETETGIWLVPGPYSGLGPVSYDASDPLGQDVYSRLAQHGHVDATHIEIVIDNGEVLLEGSVDSETTKRMAEEAVRNVAGVKQVQNLLQVRDSLN